jgi:hypothetical protein
MTTRWLLALLLAGCSTVLPADPADPTDPADVDQQSGACLAFEGRRFASVEEHECGLGPTGVVRCTWHLDIAPLDPQRSMFMWQHSDFGESGSIRCTGRQLSTDGFGRIYTGSYNPATQLLTWDGLMYTLLWSSAE